MNPLPDNSTLLENPPGRKESSNGHPKSPRKLGGIAVFILVLIAAGFAAGFLPRWQQKKQLSAESRELALTTVTIASPVPGKFGSGTLLPAEIRPAAEAFIYARASGYVRKWLVDIGAKVEAGQLLAEIDTPELNQELERSRAELKQAEAAQNLAKISANRWAELLKTSSVSEQESAEKQADFALKTATVSAAQANVKRLEELQSFSRVTAPFAGVITARSIDVGQLVRAESGRELFRLAQIDKLRVYVRAPQAQARVVQVGQSAELTIPELRGRKFAAKVVRTAGAMNPETRTLLTELEVDNTGGEILAGSFAEVKLSEAKPDAPLTVPSNTLLFRSEGVFIGIVTPENMIELRKIELGRDFGKQVEILSGVQLQDRLVLNPPDSIVSGMAVRVAEKTQVAQ